MHDMSMCTSAVDTPAFGCLRFAKDSEHSLFESALRVCVESIFRRYTESVNFSFFSVEREGTKVLVDCFGSYPVA